MAGSKSSKRGGRGKDAGPVVILVEPQLGENIGFAARAMLNCGLTELRLVQPRDGWPNPKAQAAASGADAVIEAARVFATVEEATADLQRLYATSARMREMVKPVVTPRQAASELREGMAAGERAGVLFGPERAGLANDHVALADAIIEVPLNPTFASLNLAQAVLITGYEWLLAGSEAPPRRLPLGRSPRATRAQLLGLFAHLEGELDKAGFLRNAEKRPTVIRNLRNMLERAELTAQEVRTFRGIVAALVEPRKERAGRKSPPAVAGVTSDVSELRRKI